MLRVITYRNVLRADRQAVEVKWCGQTAATVMVANWRSDWSERERVAAIVNGRKLTLEDLSLPLADGSEVQLLPDPGGAAVILTIAINVILAAATYSIAYLLAPKPKVGPQQRDDEASPTYQYNIATEFRQGFPIPVVFGEHDIGGTAIYTEVSGQLRLRNEQLIMALALCEGPIYSIGGQTEDKDLLGGQSGGPPSTGKLPADIRLNGNRLDATSDNPGVYAFTRLGSRGQLPLPSTIGNNEPAFAGVRTTLTVGAQLNEKGADATHTINNPSGVPIQTVENMFFFPSGVYDAPANATLPFQVKVSIRYREVGLSAWRVVGTFDITINKPPDRSPWAVRFGFKIPGGTTKSIEVNVRRETATTKNSVSPLIWRQLIYGVDQELAYPNVALLGVMALGSEKTGGGRPNTVSRVQGIKVRVWDDTVNQGKPSGTWDQFGEFTGSNFWAVSELTGTAWAGIWTYNPGENPAWLAVELLTNPRFGLGKWVSDDQVDWQAFRNWADYCDGDVTVGSGSEARFQCGFVLDSSVSAWEALMRICATGRAVPVIVGDKISVRYGYSGVHGRGTNSVPAKTAVQLISSANVDDFQMVYRNPQDRPGVLILQMRNKDKDYAHDAIPVEDPEGGFNDPSDFDALPFRKETVDSFGITRRSQAQRDGLFRHAANRLVPRECSFKISPEALAATLGDVIAVQHFSVRPYDSESVGYRVYQASSGSQIFLDHQVVLSASKTYSVTVRNPDGEVETRTVTASTSGTFNPGTAIPLTAAITVKKGAPLVFGEQNSLTELFEIREITMNEDLTRSVVAHLFVSSVYDDPDVGNLDDIEFGDDGVGGAEERVLAQTEEFRDDGQTIPQALGVRIEKLIDEADEHQITIGRDWAYPQQPARVYVRDTSVSNDLTGAGEGLPVEGDVTDQPAGWYLLETITRAWLQTMSLVPHKTYDVAVVLANRLGAFAAPEQGYIESSLFVDEFPYAQPPTPKPVLVAEQFEGFRIDLEPVDYDGFWCFEVRDSDISDTYWLGARVLARSIDPSIRIPYPAGDNLLIRARSRNGLYSEIVEVTLPGGSTVTPENESEASSTTTGFTGDANINGSAGLGFNLQAGALSGDITGSLSFAQESEGRLIVHISFNGTNDTITLDDLIALGFHVDSGEALWWTVDGREASPRKPGVAFGLTIADVDPSDSVRIEALDDLLVGGWVGQPGEHVAGRIFVSYDSGPLEPYLPTRRKFTDVDVTIRLYRENEDYEINTTALTAGLYVR